MVINQYLMLQTKNKACIYKFLSKSKWNDRLLNRNRIAHLNMFLDNNIRSKYVGFLSIDDTVNPKSKAKKIQGLNYHFSHVEGKSVRSHCLVTSKLCIRRHVCPVDFRPYYREEDCQNLNKRFKSKMQLAKELVENFQRPSNCEDIYVLTDSWYTNSTLVNECFKNGYHLIGAIKSNMKIAPKGKDYRVYSYEGPVSKIENANVLICYEVDDKSFKKPSHLMCTDISLDANTIIEYYLNTWSI